MQQWQQVMNNVRSHTKMKTILLHARIDADDSFHFSSLIRPSRQKQSWSLNCKASRSSTLSYTTITKHWTVRALSRNQQLRNWLQRTVSFKQRMQWCHLTWMLHRRWRWHWRRDWHCWVMQWRDKRKWWQRRWVQSCNLCLYVELLHHQHILVLYTKQDIRQTIAGYK